MDPEEVRRFAQELQRYNLDLQNRMGTLKARFSALGDSWQDQEQVKFADEFQQTMKAFRKFMEISNQHTPYLLRKAQRIEEYLKQRLPIADRANITSVEALESFQNVLVVYLDKARRTMDEISDEVKRTRTWVESDRLVHWKHEAKRRTRMLEMKQQELFSARIGNLREPTQGHQQAVRRARKSLDEANEKLDRIRRWTREFDNRVEPRARHVDKLRHTLTVDMGKAVLSLKQAIEALHKYAEVHQPQRSAPARNPGTDSGT